MSETLEVKAVASDESRRWRALYMKYASSQVPVYRVLVPQSVPDSVRSRWRARGLQLSPGSPANYLPNRVLSRNFTRRGVLFGATSTAGVGTTGAVGMGSISLAGLDVIAGGAALASTGTVAAVSAALMGVTGVRFLRDPKRLRAAEREAAAKATWITPKSFGYTWSKRGLTNPAEQQLFHTLVAISRRIVATRSWTHPIIQGDASRLDLDYVAGAVGLRLVEIASLRRELLEARDPATASRVDRYLDTLDGAFDSLATRVVGIEGYLQRLNHLDAQLAALEHEEQSRVLGDRVLDVVARTADDDAAQWELQDLHVAADSHSEAISQLLGELRTSADELDDFPADDLDRALEKERRSRPSP